MAGQGFLFCQRSFALPTLVGNTFPRGFDPDASDSEQAAAGS